LALMYPRYFLLSAQIVRETEQPFVGLNYFLFYVSHYSSSILVERQFSRLRWTIGRRRN
jgi:hypothetical protein